MPAPPPAAAQTNGPDPHQDQPAAGVQAPTRKGRFLNAVRRLIGYGKVLVETLRQPAASPSVRTITRCFGSSDIAAILVRIARGLHRAAALEAWLITWVPRRAAASARAPAPRQPRAAQPAAPRADDPRPAPHARGHRRPRPPPPDRRGDRRDLLRSRHCPGSELWREVSSAVIQGGGSPVTLFRDAVSRLLPVGIFDPSDIARPHGRQYRARRRPRPRVPARPERTAWTIEATCTGPAHGWPRHSIPRPPGGAADAENDTPPPLVGARVCAHVMFAYGTNGGRKFGSRS